MGFFKYNECSSSFTGQGRTSGHHFFNLLIELWTGVFTKEFSARDGNESTSDLILEKHDEDDEEIVEKILKDPTEGVKFIKLRYPPDNGKGDDTKKHLIRPGSLNDQKETINDKPYGKNIEQINESKIGK